MRQHTLRQSDSLTCFCDAVLCYEFVSSEAFLRRMAHVQLTLDHAVRMFLPNQFAIITVTWSSTLSCYGDAVCSCKWRQVLVFNVMCSVWEIRNFKYPVLVHNLLLFASAKRWVLHLELKTTIRRHKNRHLTAKIWFQFCENPFIRTITHCW